MPVRLKPATAWSRVKHSTTEQQRSQTAVGSALKNVHLENEDNERY